MTKRMEAPIKTISDAGQVIAGMSARLQVLQWVVSGCAVAGFVAAGGLMVTTYNLGQSVASLTTAMQGTQTQMDQLRQEMAGLRADTATNLSAIRLELAAIRQALNVQPVPPEKGGFPENQPSPGRK
jgi:hypothetical protein